VPAQKQNIFQHSTLREFIQLIFLIPVIFCTWNTKIVSKITVVPIKLGLDEFAMTTFPVAKYP